MVAPLQCTELHHHLKLSLIDDEVLLDAEGQEKVVHVGAADELGWCLPDLQGQLLVPTDRTDQGVLPEERPDASDECEPLMIILEG